MHVLPIKNPAFDILILKQAISYNQRHFLSTSSSGNYADGDCEVNEWLNLILAIHYALNAQPRRNYIPYSYYSYLGLMMAYRIYQLDSCQKLWRDNRQSTPSQIKHQVSWPQVANNLSSLATYINKQSKRK